MRGAHKCSRRTVTRWSILSPLDCNMDSHVSIARALASAILLGELDVDALVARCATVVGTGWRWLRPLVQRVATHFLGQTRARRRDVVEFILNDRGFHRACFRHEITIEAWPIATAQMLPVPVAAQWNLPAICTAGALAEWLGLSVGQLEWFADLRAMEAKQEAERLRNYRYRVLAKRFGNVRLIEAPKPRLKDAQRQILTEILDKVPPHESAHGFRRVRSIKSFTAPHVGRQVVLKIDLHDFFPSIAAARVQALFRTIGYPETVADLLAGVCTNQSPPDVWDRELLAELGPPAHAVWRLYARPHLPQGAPTSPALANLCAYRLDCRLAGLARAAGATYTRYADDLAFSGDEDFARVVHRFQHHACATILEEGFRPHYRKTRIMRQGVRQQLAGIVVNRRQNTLRAVYDQLKAILTNCVRFGPQSQNRGGHDSFRAHLMGRVAFVESIHIERGRKLRELLERIEW